MATGDLLLGNLTHAMGSTINTEVCDEVVSVTEDSFLESEEVFSIFASEFLTIVEDLSNGEMVEVDGESISLLITPPCENVTITIDTSDTEG